MSFGIEKACDSPKRFVPNRLHFYAAFAEETDDLIDGVDVELNHHVAVRGRYRVLPPVERNSGAASRTEFREVVVGEPFLEPENISVELQHLGKISGEDQYGLHPGFCQGAGRKRTRRACGGGAPHERVDSPPALYLSFAKIRVGVWDAESHATDSERGAGTGI
jgi:hypothetical protein